jgi:DNA-binding response OmpR family regulator
MPSSERILLVDDEPTLVAAMKFNLEKEGYEVIAVADGEAAVAAAREQRPHLVILDLMLPGMDGFNVCRLLRKETNVPIIIVTAKTEEVDKVVGLELGADDYVTKPFSMKELIARVRAQLRRAVQPTRVEPDQTLSSGDLTVDLLRREVTKAGQSQTLTSKEFDLLVFLMRNRGQTLTRDQLLQRIWGYEAMGQTRTVDVHIGRLRDKIEDDADQPARIITVRGVGYRFTG